MAFIRTPVKGMPDFSPADVRLREQVLGVIKSTYAEYGFMQIETPSIEHIENLTGGQGGENEKLIFQVMKRGEELRRALENGKDLADCGLRFDLTLPLSRYYADNCNELPAPFKAMQIGNVWRADRPQKGRFRQFTQCDIDILGDRSVLAEIELISGVCQALTRILAQADLAKFTVHLNDRRILKALAAYAGFAEADYDSAFISLDKFDKIGAEGVRAELLKNGFAASAVDKCLDVFAGGQDDLVAFCRPLVGQYLDPAALAGLETILGCVRAIVGPDVSLKFDPTLVRGMSYYTGAIFECTLDGYDFSVAGGGRYDEMVERFIGQSVPACGFSIGFERIVTILKDHLTAEQLAGGGKIALLVEEGLSRQGMIDVCRHAQDLRQQGKIVTVLPMKKKNLKFQTSRLSAEGYDQFEKFYQD